MAIKFGIGIPGGGGNGDVTAAAALGDNLLVRGDGSTKGVQNTGISIDDSDNMVIGGNISLSETKRINFDGDANTYIGASADGILDIYSDGARVFGTVGTNVLFYQPILATNGNGIQLSNGAPGATTPNIIPRRTDLTTGIGSLTTGVLNLVASGINAVAIDNDSMTLSVFLDGSTTAGITASTTQTQGQGALTAEVNQVSTVANIDDTVTLPAAVAGRRCFVINSGANRLQIFPASGDNLGTGVDTAVSIGTAVHAEFMSFDGTTWLHIGPALGEITVAAGVTTQVTNGTADTFDIITGWNTAQGTNGEETSAINVKASNKITLTRPGRYNIMFACSYEGTTNEKYAFKAYVDGVAAPPQMQRKIGTGTDVGYAAVMGVVVVTAGQDLDMRVAADGISVNFIPRFMNLTAVRLSG